MGGNRRYGPHRVVALALKRQDGFSLIEATVALTLFLILATALSGLLSSSVAAQRVARERTIAKQQVLAEIETIRRLPYDNVGIVAGNPPGVIVASKPISLTGLQATMATQVQYVSDPTPTSYATSANYKKVTVTVTRTKDSKQLMRSVTYIAPAARAPYGGINNAIINAEVVDFALNTPIIGAAVGLATGPSAPRNDVTDETGTASFPALTPNPTSGSTAYYDISAGATGYTTLSDDLSPGAAAHVQLAPGQTFNTAIRLYLPARILVTVPGWTSGGHDDRPRRLEPQERDLHLHGWHAHDHVARRRARRPGHALHGVRDEGQRLHAPVHTGGLGDGAEQLPDSADPELRAGARVGRDDADADRPGAQGREPGVRRPGRYHRRAVGHLPDGHDRDRVLHREPHLHGAAGHRLHGEGLERDRNRQQPGHRDQRELQRDRHGQRPVTRLLGTMRREAGFTVIELVVAMGVLGILGAAFAFVLGSTVTHSSATQDAAIVQHEARAAVDRFAADLRQAYTGDTAVYPIEVVNSTTVRFLSPDRAVPSHHLRRISYRLNAGKLERQEGISTDTDGPPWNILASGPWSKLVGGITTAAPFTFFDANGAATTNPLNVRTVRLQMTVRGTGGRTSIYGTTVTVRSDA